MKAIRFTPEQAILKIKQYCSYQERSHKEVKEKLYSFGLYKTDVEKIISQIIEEKYLNEERFAIQFAGGKFRMKQWGKAKIRYALKEKYVSDYCIKKALASIDEQDYRKVFLKLAKNKIAVLANETNILSKKRKLQNYLIGKGYEASEIHAIIKKLLDKKQLET